MKQAGAEANKALQKDAAHANRCYEALVAHFSEEVSVRGHLHCMAVSQFSSNAVYANRQ